MKKYTDFILNLYLVLFLSLFFPKHLQSQNLSKIINQDREKFLSLETFSQVLYYLEKNYVEAEKASLNKSIKKAIEGVTKDLDPHTLLLPPSSYSQLSLQTKGRFGGIGIVTSQENSQLIIVSTIEGGPAHQAGVLAKDKIIAIDGIAINTLNSAEILDMMRGLPGSKIKLKLRRQGKRKAITLQIKRSIIKSLI